MRQTFLPGTSPPFYAPPGSIVTVTPDSATVTYTTEADSAVRNGVATFATLPLESGQQYIKDGMWIRVTHTSSVTVDVDENPSPAALKRWVGDYGEDGSLIDAEAAGLPESVPASLGGGTWNSEKAIAYVQGKGYIDARDYGVATANSAAANATALAAAFAAAGTAQRGLLLPAGQINYTGPLSVPTNCHIYGQGGTSYGSQLIANGTDGLYFDGSETEKFHASLNNVMLRHTGAAAAYALKIENTYSLRLNCVRFDTPAAQYSDAALVIEDTNNDILITDPIMQFSTQQLIGIRCGDACGTIRIFKPDIENCERAIKWEGGHVEVYSPYVELSAVNSFDLTPTTTDIATGSFKCWGGILGCASGAVNIAVRANAHDVFCYGTRISGSTSNDLYVYSTSVARCNFTDMHMDFAKFQGVAGYERVVDLRGRRLVGSKTQDWASIAAGSSASTTVTVTGAAVGRHTARAYMDIDSTGLILFAEVSAANTVRVTAFNPTGSAIDLASTGLYAIVDSAARL